MKFLYRYRKLLNLTQTGFEYSFYLYMYSIHLCSFEILWYIFELRLCVIEKYWSISRSLLAIFTEGLNINPTIRTNVHIICTLDTLILPIHTLHLHNNQYIHCLHAHYCNIYSVLKLHNYIVIANSHWILEVRIRYYEHISKFNYSIHYTSFGYFTTETFRCYCR